MQYYCPMLRIHRNYGGRRRESCVVHVSTHRSLLKQIVRWRATSPFSAIHRVLGGHVRPLPACSFNYPLASVADSQMKLYKGAFASAYRLIDSRYRYTGCSDVMIRSPCRGGLCYVENRWNCIPVFCLKAEVFQYVQLKAQQCVGTVTHH